MLTDERAHSELIPDYKTVIQEPMDFGTIKKRVEHNNYYRDFELFQVCCILGKTIKCMLTRTTAYICSATWR